jgi:tetratricopeptide (TPR) repeat protein
LKLEPGNVEAMAILGRCKYRNAEKDAGLKLMNEALSKNPNDLEVALEMAKTDSEEKQSPKAEALLTKMIARYPENIVPLMRRAALYNEENKPDAALADLQKVFKLNPNYQPAFAMRARMLEDQKKYELAIKDCVECMKVKDGMDNISRKCLRTKLQCEEHLGRNKEALTDLQTFSKDVENEKKKWTPSSERTYIKIVANHEKLKQYDQALKAVAVIQRFEPGNTEAMSYKARILHEMGKNQDSIAEYDRLLATNPRMQEWLDGKAKALKSIKEGEATAQDQSKN